VRDPVFEVAPPRLGPRLTRAQIAWRGVAGGVFAASIGILAAALLSALTKMRQTSGSEFDLVAELDAFLRPSGMAGWIGLVGVAVFGLLCGLLTAAVAVARQGGGEEDAENAAPVARSGSR